VTGDRRALRGLAALLATVLVALGVLVPAPARADHTSLCTGYAACKQAGYSHAGYRNNNDTMYWRMYSGHNCTNYVAYRLVQSGMPNTRPWSGGGNASYWGHEMDHLTDRTPMVGAVAWWDSYDGYAGSNGHVAYVERVVSRNEIIVSEDMWGGDFHWRRITKGGSGWPTGFIHFNDAAVTARSGPSISGTARVGEQLTASTGAWRPNASESLQWFAAGKPIAGATGTTLTPTPEQRKKRLSVKVVATKKWYVDGEATSDRTIKVQRGRFERRSAPEVTGTVQVGHTLTTTRGGYSPAPDSTTIQWYADGEPVEGATGRTLRLRPALVGARITSRISVVRDGYRTLRSASATTRAVEPGRIDVVEPFGLEGTARRGKTLTFTPGEVAPGDAEVTWTWLRDGERVADPDTNKRGTTYRLRPDDVGHVISVRVQAARDGYTTHREVHATDGPVTTRSRLAVDAQGKTVEKTKGKGKKKTTRTVRKIVVRLDVTALGVDRPGGPVAVKVGDRVVEGTVEDGAAKLVLKRVDPGKHRVRVVYDGTKVVEGAREVVTVRVPRKP